MSESSAWDDLDAPVPATVTVRGVSVGVGHRVRLQPLAGGDVMDIALAGRLAVVESIDVTTEGEPRFVVTIDDDPGRDLGGRRYPAHRFFFRSEEIEPLVETTGDGREAASDSARVRVLVAGIGNIFFGDDGFGVAAARRLAKEALPAGVVVRDFGIRGLDLAYALQEDLDAAVLIDAIARGGEPGTLHVLEPNLEADAIGDTLDAHVMDPVRVLRLAEALGKMPPRIIVVGCEPLSLEGGEPLADELVALSPPVRDAVERAAGLLKTIIRNLTSTELHRTEDKDDVNSGLGLGDRRDRRGHPDHLDDSHANPPNAPVLSHEGDVVSP